MTLERGLMRPKVARNLKASDVTGIKFQHPPTHFKHQPHYSCHDSNLSYTAKHAVPDSENQLQKLHDIIAYYDWIYARHFFFVR